LALAFALNPLVALAQSDGAITGIVRDVSGLPTPGVVVRLALDEHAAGVEAITDERGVYRAEGLAAGTYRVTATLGGFEPYLMRVDLAVGQTVTLDVTLEVSGFSQGVVVSARRFDEAVQEVPIPVSVIDGTLIADAGAFNVNRLKELVPTVQFYSSNPRNASVSIRGLGAPFGLTNDGIEPGVGLYIDGTFYARPAAATLDFLDVERVEVARGPQGTLFGKNTTAGAIQVTTRRPRFTPESDLELNFGSLGLMQAKASVTGALSEKMAGRLSLAATRRSGTIYNTTTRENVNELNNLGFRGQLLYSPSDKTAISISADNTRQRPRGYAQVVAGVAPTLRPANRQYAQIAADLGYTPPSFDAFDRVTDSDTPWRSNQSLGGASLTVARRLRGGTLTSISAWRRWHWDPSNDRDFIGLPVTTISANPSTQHQLTQEVRYAGDLTPQLEVVVGAFAFRQSIDSTGKQEQGPAAARFLLAPSPLAATPGLLDGYGQRSDINSTFASAAVFGQLEWSVTDKLRLLPGLRWNYDDKYVDFETTVYGGLQTTDPELIALQRSVLAPQAYHAGAADANVSGNVTTAYQLRPAVNAFVTYATSFKSIGLNLSGVPSDSAGQPILTAAAVKPEDVRHVEFGVKTEPLPGIIANATVFSTDVRNYQANVVNAQVGVLRGYLANAERVRVRGVEIDANARVGSHLSLHGAGAFNDGKYVSFSDAPPPLEETGGPAVKDISGSSLAGVSRWAWSLGGEYVEPATVMRRPGEFFGAVEASYRSAFSSSATPSKYLTIQGYALVNARLGFRWSDGWGVSVWMRNMFDERYFELLSAAPGNSGLIVGLPADPRSVGVTLRMNFRRR
jgi:iron complex outermembrane receptor protein